jgi:hypothetical protein
MIVRRTKDAAVGRLSLPVHSEVCSRAPCYVERSREGALLWFKPNPRLRPRFSSSGVLSAGDSQRGQGCRSGGKAGL